MHGVAQEGVLDCECLLLLVAAPNHRLGDATGQAQHLSSFLWWPSAPLLSLPSKRPVFVRTWWESLSVLVEALRRCLCHFAYVVRRVVELTSEGEDCPLTIGLDPILWHYRRLET